MVKRVLLLSAIRFGYKGLNSYETVFGFMLTALRYQKLSCERLKDHR